MLALTVHGCSLPSVGSPVDCPGKCTRVCKKGIYTLSRLRDSFRARVPSRGGDSLASAPASARFVHPATRTCGLRRKPWQVVCNSGRFSVSAPCSAGEECRAPRRRRHPLGRGTLREGVGEAGPAGRRPPRLGTPAVSRHRGPFSSVPGGGGPARPHGLPWRWAPGLSRERGEVLGFHASERLRWRAGTGGFSVSRRGWE